MKKQKYFNFFKVGYFITSYYKMYSLQSQDIIDRYEFLRYNVSHKNSVDNLKKQLSKYGLILKSYQRFVVDFMNPHTPFKTLLLKHDTGVGKTISSLFMATNFIKIYQQYYNINPLDTPNVFVIGYTSTVFINELINRPEFGFVTRDEIEHREKLRSLAEDGTERDKQAYVNFVRTLKTRLSKKSIGGFYNFAGYQKLSNRIFNLPEGSKLPYEELVKGIEEGSIEINMDQIVLFKNGFMICDEFHRTFNKKEMNNYGNTIRFLLDFYNAPEKLNIKRPAEVEGTCLHAVFPTATPLSSSPHEVIDLLNMLDSHNRLTVDDLFDGMRLTKKGEELLSDAFEGRVSFLSDGRPEYFPTKRYIGEPIEGIKYLLFDKCPLTKKHAQLYKTVYNGSITADGYSLNDIAFPTPSGIAYKTSEIQHELSEAPRTWLAKHKVELVEGEVRGAYLKYENIKEWSSKDARIIEILKDNLKKRGGKTFIYHEHVHISGVLHIANLLRENGFIDENGTPTKETLCSMCGLPHYTEKGKDHIFTPAKFILAYGEIPKPVLDRSIEKLNQAVNTTGDIYNVIIGSQMVKESFNFIAIKNLIVVSMPDDISTLQQIIGRTSRQNSHSLLPPEERYVDVRILISTPAHAFRKPTYEMEKWAEKVENYIEIQKINRIMHKRAVDSSLNYDIIQPKKKPELGVLYYEPEIQPSGKLIKSTWRAYFVDTTIKDIVAVIKRLFLISSVWKYTDLKLAINEPPFHVEINTAIIGDMEKDYAIGLLTDNSYTSDLYDQSTTMFDTLLRENKYIINKRGQRCILEWSGDFIVMLPVYSTIDEDYERLNKFQRKHVRAYPLGQNIQNIYNKVDRSYTAPYREMHVYRVVLNISDVLQKSKISYFEMKSKFYKKYGTLPPEEIPTTTDIYGLEFHNRLLDESIEYIFNAYTNPKTSRSEYHEFYFKMLYFYTILNIVVFADHVDNDIYELYKNYVTAPGVKNRAMADVADLVDQSGYNKLLMTSIEKITGEYQEFDLKRVDDLIAKKPHKVDAEILPIGHLLDTVSGSVKLYLPTRGWFTSGINLDYTTEVENDVVIGYYEFIPGTITMKFKLRSPKQNQKDFIDARKIKKGIACDTKNKASLITLSRRLGLSPSKKSNVHDICEAIKKVLMQKELASRRRWNKLSNYKKKITPRIRWFYYTFEK